MRIESDFKPASVFDLHLFLRPDGVNFGDLPVKSIDILVQSNPLDVVKILKLSEASFRKQKQNIWWGAGYNIVMIPLAAGILAPFGFIMPPAVGAFLMSISTVIVAINAMTLKGTDLNVENGHQDSDQS